MGAQEDKARGWRRKVVVGLLALGLLALAWDQAHRWLPQAVDLARGLPGVGFGRMHRLEQAVFGVIDGARRAFEPQARVGEVRSPPPELAGVWPPAPLLPVLTDPQVPGEGLWAPLVACGGEVAGGALMVTRLRVDPLRSEAEVVLVAMDLERVGLALRVGRDDGGSGAIGAGEAGRVVAAFNGGFQRQHGGFGVVAEGREVVPLMRGAATVAADDAGRLWMGPWSSGQPAMARQNLPPLLTGGVSRELLHVEVDGRREQIGHSVTRRSGLCLRGDRTAIYLWTRRGTAATLGRAMVAAGCDEGMHLDLNAFHTAFEALGLEGAARGDDGAWVGGCAQRLDPGMKDNPAGRYLQPQTRDFFIVERRPAPLPRPRLEAPPGR